MKRTANSSVDIDMSFEAKSPDTNIPQTLKPALRKDVTTTQAKQWKKDNKTAIQSSNTWVSKHGLPLAKYRQFPL